MRPMWRLSLVVAAMGLVLISAFSCSKPTKHQEKKGVRLYVQDVQSEKIYAYDADTHQLLDSLPGIYSYVMISSADGRFLFTSAYLPGNAYALRKIATAPLHVVAEFPMAGGLSLLEQGSILMRSNLSNLVYIDPLSFRVIRTDSLGLRDVGTADSVGFFVGSDSLYRIVAYDFRRKIVLDADSIFLEDGIIAEAHKLSLHPSGKEGYAMLEDAHYRSWFAVFQTPELKLKAVYRLQDSFGHIAVSPDGRYVLFNDPGNVWHGFLVGDFFVYDVAAERIVKSTNILWGDSTCCSPCLELGKIVFVPDGSRAFVSCGLSGGGPILIFDMMSMKFVDQVDEGEWLFSHIAVAPEP